MILEFLLNYFLTEFNEGEFKPLYDLLSANNFDIFSTLKSAKPQDFAPLIKLFMRGKSENINTPESLSFEGVNPIKNFADENIISTLNTYFSNSN